MKQDKIKVDASLDVFVPNHDNGGDKDVGHTTNLDTSKHESDLVDDDNKGTKVASSQRSSLLHGQDLLEKRQKDAAKISRMSAYYDQSTSTWYPTRTWPPTYSERTANHQPTSIWYPTSTWSPAHSEITAYAMDDD